MTINLTRRTLLVAGGLCAAAPTLAWAKSAGDTQPLWMIKKDRATVYLYGNGGSPTPKWSAPRVWRAFDEAAVFWKETPELLLSDQPKYLAAGLDRARPLSTWLTADERERLTAACAEAGTTYAALEPFKPWFATVLLTQAYAKVSKRPPMEDPIPVLTARAKATGKPIRTEFPDAESQITLFNGMSRDAQTEYMFYTIENHRLTQEIVDRRHQAWAAGDLSLETRQVAHLKKDYPNLYEPFEAARNRAWPARFRQMLADGGVTFVMVGADHLVGADSLLVQLAAAGIRMKRI